MKNHTSSTTPDPNFLDVSQAAKRMGKSKNFVRLLCNEGQLAGATQDREAGPWRIPAEAVEVWIKQHVTNNIKHPGQVRAEQITESRSRGFLAWQERLRSHPLIIILTTLVAIVAFIGVLISFGADFGPFQQQLREWGICIYCREFPSASNQETLIVVATFHNTAETNSEVHTKIQRAIAAEAAKHGEQSLRVAVESSELTADQRPQAVALGKLYNASMVIWGEDTGVEVIVNFLNLNEPDFDAAAVTVTERERTQLANPSAYTRFITDDLPQQMTFFALFAIGQSYYLNKDYPMAMARIEAALAVLPSTMTPDSLFKAYFLLGWLYQESATQLNQAITAYDKAIKLDPNYYDAYNNRGLVHKGLGNVTAAIADYDKAIELDPENAIAYNNRGLAYDEQDELAAAIDDFNKAIELIPENAAVYYNRGITHSAQGDLAAAMADYDKAIELNPENAAAYYNRGVIHSAQGNLAAAMADYDKAIELNPEDAAAYYNRGITHKAQGDLAAAIADYDRAIELNPNTAAYNNRGLAHAEQGKLIAAITDFDKAIELDPENATAYNNRGLAYDEQGELAAAIDDFNKAIELAANYAIVYYNRGMTHSAQGDLAAAMADYDKAIELNPEDAAAYTNRGVIHSAQGNLAAAMADYDKAIELAANYATAYYNRGIIHSARGDLAAAIADYDRAIELNSEDAAAYYNRALAHQDQGELMAAINDFRYYLKLQPDVKSRAQIEQRVAELEAALINRK